MVSSHSPLYFHRRCGRNRKAHYCKCSHTRFTDSLYVKRAVLGSAPGGGFFTFYILGPVGPMDSGKSINRRQFELLCTKCSTNFIQILHPSIEFEHWPRRHSFFLTVLLCECLCVPQPHIHKTDICRYSYSRYTYHLPPAICTSFSACCKHS